MSNDKKFEIYLEILTLYSSNRGREKEVESLTVDIERTPFYQITVQTGVAKGNSLS